MNLTVFGAGYVGLVSGACFADRGNDVVCVDVDATRIDGLNQDIVPIHEPGLQALVAANRRAGRLRFTTDAASAVTHGEVLFIAVGTPPAGDGGADLSHVLQVADAIGRHMREPKLIVGKSTVPVGTADEVRARVREALAKRGAALAFDVVSNPEFLKEGAAVADFMKPDRIIIGSESEAAARRLERLYAPFNRNHDKITRMDTRSAELTKYAANVMLATRISLMNELANLAERLGADIEAVRRGIGADPRIGTSFIYAGIGFGGSCFPKDVRALIRTARDADFDAAITRSVDAVNERQKTRLFDKIRHHFDDDLAGRVFAFWGLAFKPNTDDMREAPGRALMERLWAAGAAVRAYDPAAMGEARRIYGEREDFTLCATREAALEGADALVVTTEWNEFHAPDFEHIKAALKQPVIFDGRNLYDPAMLRELGLRHFAVGRAVGHPAPT